MTRIRKEGELYLTTPTRVVRVTPDPAPSPVKGEGYDTANSL
jgi:hypothetical protein